VQNYKLKLESEFTIIEKLEKCGVYQQESSSRHCSFLSTWWIMSASELM
jgi:hypothetical protein